MQGENSLNTNQEDTKNNLGETKLAEGHPELMHSREHKSISPSEPDLQKTTAHHEPQPTRAPEKPQQAPAKPRSDQPGSVSTDQLKASQQPNPNVKQEDSVVPDQPIFKTGMLFYRDKPVFGIDIGYSSIKIMQINQSKGSNTVTGYGVTHFDPKIIADGIIADPNALAQLIDNLLKQPQAASIDTKRVVLGIPTARTFIRSVILPIAAAEDLDSAVQFEVEQYTPLPLKEMYMDYNVIGKTDKDVRLLVAAVPKKIANSYMAVATALNFEVIAIEPTLGAVSRMFAKFDHQADIPTVLIDFGAISSNVILYDKGVISAGTVPGGGETFGALVANRLHITQQESHFMKTQYGVGHGYKQQEILAAIEEQLDQIVQEIRRVMRYYQEHFNAKKINQIVITGGGSNLSGLTDFLTDRLRTPTRLFAPWQMNFNIQQFTNENEKSIYVTSGGLALLKPREVFA